eukprot:TRINITY_DN2218_c0_g1_i1.p1 TRINITY_DN2218_c0_g1~~TRINITY_DN2218_c0_g1_i1.p1  ORF type:complete len:410 (+),score=170.81 TRINITY_DN2218_c0_g1_i1:59-1288(+)
MLYCVIGQAGSGRRTLVNAAYQLLKESAEFCFCACITTDSQQATLLPALYDALNEKEFISQCEAGALIWAWKEDTFQFAYPSTLLSLLQKELQVVIIVPPSLIEDIRKTVKQNIKVIHVCTPKSVIQTRVKPVVIEKKASTSSSKRERERDREREKEKDFSSPLSSSLSSSSSPFVTPSSFSSSSSPSSSLFSSSSSSSSSFSSSLSFREREKERDRDHSSSSSSKNAISSSSSVNEEWVLPSNWNALLVDNSTADTIEPAVDKLLSLFSLSPSIIHELKSKCTSLPPLLLSLSSSSSSSSLSSSSSASSSSSSSSSSTSVAFSLHSDLDLKTCSPQDYLKATVFPLLYAGLNHVDSVRPSDPVELLALFLLRQSYLIRTTASQRKEMELTKKMQMNQVKTDASSWERI